MDLPFTSQPLEAPSHPGAFRAEVLWNEQPGVPRLCTAYWFSRALDLSAYEQLSRHAQQEAQELIVAPVHVERLTSGDFRSLLIERDLTARSLRSWSGQRGAASRDLGVIRALLASLTAALDSLHNADLWHLNLRPEVVEVHEVKGQLCARIGGFSRLMKASHMGVSTSDYPLHAYAAPELDFGAARQCSDFWSLGVVMYELVAGRHPFGHDGHLLEDAAVNYWLQDRRRIDCDAVDHRWERLLRGLLTHDDDRRSGRIADRSIPAK